MAHGSALTSNKKGRKKCCLTSFLYWLKLRCCVRRRIAILIRYTLKTPSVHYWRSHKDEISVNFRLLIPSFTEAIPPFTVHEYVELSMSGSRGTRSFADIITCIRYWVIHNKPIPSLFTRRIKGLVIRQHGFSFLFWYRFGSPRPKEYFTESRQGIPFKKMPFFFFGTTRWI